MECRKIQEYFSAYLDGELSEAQEELVSRHLEVLSSLSAGISGLAKALGRFGG